MQASAAKRFGVSVGTATLVALALLGLVGPRLVSADPFAIGGPALAPPSTVHWFGTDDLGRDVFAGFVHGATISILVGLAAAVLSGAIGLSIGGVAGSRGGFADLALMRLTEFAQALPRFFLLVTLVSLFGGRLAFVVLAIGLTAWPATARTFRAQVLSLRSRDFVVASRASGGREAGILRRHLLPMAAPILAAQMSYQAGGAILAEAGLSFLGLGDPNVMTWGMQLGSAQHFVREAWWMSVFPGLGVTLTVMACNLLADNVNRRRR